MTERELLDAIVELARAFGWLVHHDRPAQNRRGRWSTPIQGDPGFPDLVLVRPPRVVFCELKSLRGELTPAQSWWLETLAQCSRVETFLWTPRDWLDGVVEHVLRGDRPDVETTREERDDVDDPDAD